MFSGVGPQIVNSDTTGAYGGNSELGQTQRANIAAAPSLLAQQLKQQRFNTVLPMLQGAMGAPSVSFGSSGGNSATGGGPNISANPIWNAQQIQGQVNQAQAQGAQKVGTQTQQMQQGLGGRGFGSNSPLAQELGGQFQMANNATQAANEQATRFNAAQGNAQQVLSGQQAQQAQYAGNQQAYNQQLATLYGHQNALMAALAGMT